MLLTWILSSIRWRTPGKARRLSLWTLRHPRWLWLYVEGYVNRLDQGLNGWPTGTFGPGARVLLCRLHWNRRSNKEMFYEAVKNKLTIKERDSWTSLGFLLSNHVWIIIIFMAKHEHITVFRWGVHTRFWAACSTFRSWSGSFFFICKKGNELQLALHVSKWSGKLWIPVKGHVKKEELEIKLPLQHSAAEHPRCNCWRHAEFKVTRQQNQCKNDAS